MLLTITSTHVPATDLGYLLHKHPERLHSRENGFGNVRIFYPEASEERCTCALLLEVDPVGLVRGRRNAAGESNGLDSYVNDRPYVASSFLSVAMGQVFREAMNGQSKERPELTETPMPLEAHLPAVPCRGGEEFLRRLFEPLGYEVELQAHVLDETFPQWGQSPYFSLTLCAQTRLRDLLTHLYVLIPVLDDEKHYWVGEDEVEKLLRRGEGWLSAHPEREIIARRYLRRDTRLTREAVARLTQDDVVDADDAEEQHDAEEAAVERPLSLHEQRLNAVMDALKESGAQRVLDLGCGEGRLLQLLLKQKQFSQIVGVDVSHRALATARDRLRFDRLPPMQQQRITLMQGSLIYRDARLRGFDAAAVVEVIEHLDPARLGAFERVVFEFAQPETVIVTTPNAEYNVKWDTLPAGTMRHKDHRFEWTREQFATWAQRIAAQYEYSVTIAPIGPQDETVGAPSQMAVFARAALQSDEGGETKHGN